MARGQVVVVVLATADHLAGEQVDLQRCTGFVVEVAVAGTPFVHGKQQLVALCQHNLLQGGAARCRWVAAPDRGTGIDFDRYAVGRAVGRQLEELVGGAGFGPGLPEASIDAINAIDWCGELRHRRVAAAR